MGLALDLHQSWRVVVHEEAAKWNAERPPFRHRYDFWNQHKYFVGGYSTVPLTPKDFPSFFMSDHLCVPQQGMDFQVRSTPDDASSRDRGSLFTSPTNDQSQTPCVARCKRILSFF